MQGYTCTDGAKSVVLTKEQLNECIKAKKVSNATSQVYKGTLIIRVKGDVPVVIQGSAIQIQDKQLNNTDRL